VQFCIAAVVFILLGGGITVLLKAFIGDRADLMPLVLQWLPLSVGLPMLIVIVCRREGRALVFAIGVLVSPVVMWSVYETATYVVDMGLPLDQRRVNVERLYHWDGTKSLSEWRLVDDQGQEFRFPFFVERPSITAGPYILEVTRLRNIVLDAEPAPDESK
jgi:hypothetical protein